MRPFLLPALFAVTALGAWAWFHIAPPVQADPLRFEVHASLADWQFVDDPVPPRQQEILLTTNVFNGSFRPANSPGEPVIVFSAFWDSRDGRQRAGLPHTPDICWVGGGWLLVNAGQPPYASVSIGGREIPFQCRLFQAPSGQRQLVMWCSVLGGKPVVGDAPAFPTAASPGERKAENLDRQRTSMFAHFLQAVRDRDGAADFKQFVRMSVAIDGDNWRAGLDRLRAFAPEWLELRRAG